MIKPTQGFYIIYTKNGKWGAFSTDVYADWNSHLKLKFEKRHPLGDRFTLQYLGPQRTTFQAIDWEMPKADRNYGIGFCDNCGIIYVKRFDFQRFHSHLCRVSYFRKKKLREKKRDILEICGYKCSSGPEVCAKWGYPIKLRVWWSGDKKPYCHNCIARKIHEKAMMRNES